MTPHSPGWYDSMYNNRALVPNFARHLAQWKTDSARARASQRCLLDVAYGAGPGETLDVFTPPRPQAPVVVFIHGGYWRSLDKSDHSFVAPALVQQGACVVVPNYALCPAVTIPQIVLQLVKAVAWTWRYIHHWGGDPRRIHVQGHSAGGHLAAMMLACLWSRYSADLPADVVKSALSISGLHELESMRQTPFLQESLHLNETQVLQASPAWMPAPAQGRLVSVAGGLESDEFKRQCQLIQDAWGAQCVPTAEVLPGLNHFSVVEALTQPGHRLHQLALSLWR